MKSDITKVLNILDIDAAFITKDFSNGYNFDENKAEDYFNELATNSGDTPIFSGLIILQKDNINYSIVDGLQRITTINLLIAALCYVIQKKHADAAERIKHKYIVKDNRSKLKLLNNENMILNKIIFERNLESSEKESNLYKVYHKFITLLEEKQSLPNKILKVLTQVQYLFVITKESEIATRDLYQSLNIIKKDSQINLITDFIYQQGFQAQKSWDKIVELFNVKSNKPENFIKDFLQARYEAGVINPDAVYTNFKKYYEKMQQYQSSKEILETMKKYALFYLRIINDDFSNPEIKKQISILNENSDRQTYPYLMEVLDDLESGNISEKAFLNILIMMNSYIASNQKEDNINGIKIDFAKLSKELNKMMVIKDYTPEEIFSENKLTINDINNLSNFEV